ncbi:MAG: hypothetical protein U0869_07850 [Chloroflexota bacterium]
MGDPVLDEAFDGELRAAFQDTLPTHAPPSLVAALPSVVRQRPPRSAGVRPLALGAAAVVTLAVVGSLGLGPVTTRLMTTAGPVASPPLAPSPHEATSRSAQTAAPAPGPYDWSTPLVRLIADDIVLTADGKPIPVQPHLPATGDPGDPSRRSLDLYWTAEGREQRFSLEFRADAHDWWVSEARIYDNMGSAPDWITFAGTLARTPIGQAFHGNVDLQSTNGRVPGTITMRGATIDPVGLGAGPRAFTGCTPYARLDLETQQALSAASDPARIERLAADHDLCRVYFWTTRSRDGDWLAEVWCVPPPSGTLRLARVGDLGELVVFVDDLTVPREPRPQPMSGWGCTRSGSGSPAATPATAVAYDWGGGGVTLEAEALVFGAGDADHPFIAMVPSGVAPTRRHVAAGVDELRWDWVSESPNRLVMRVISDGTTWRVDRVGYQDRGVSDTVIRWTDVPISARVGQPWIGDVLLASTDAQGAPGLVRMQGVTFDPGVSPAILEAPPSPTPFPDRPFVIDNGHVRVSADGLDLGLDGDIYHGPAGTADQAATTSAARKDALQASWMDEDRLVQLRLEFRSDGHRWWLSDGWISAWGANWAPLDVTGIGAPLGIPFTGDLAQSLPQMNPGPGRKATGEQLQLTIRNLSLEPFRGR